MKPVFQTRLGNKGNCFEACIASILELELKEVPDLLAYEESGEWVDKLNTWLSKFGLCYIEVIMDDIPLFFKNKSCYYIYIGKTTRNDNIHHAAVGYNGNIVHDPIEGGSNFLHTNIKLGFFVRTFCDD